MSNDIAALVEQGPELTRLLERLYGNPARMTKNVHFDWGPEASKMTVEERAAMLNRVFDEMDHPVLGLIAELKGKAFIFKDSAVPNFDVKTKAYLPLTGKQKSAKHIAELLLRAADKLAEMNSALTPDSETRHG